ncbi:MAG: helix-turn-helix domain-containing protein [Nitrospirae bacterium]|nr:helix-turn-helix domain-containing protein [Nitrospirota bacterium]
MTIDEALRAARVGRREFYTTGDVARLLGVSGATVRRMVERGDLEAYRPGWWLRFRHGDVADYLAGCLGDMWDQTHVSQRTSSVGKNDGIQPISTNSFAATSMRYIASVIAVSTAPPPPALTHPFAAMAHGHGRAGARRVRRHAVRTTPCA